MNGVQQRARHSAVRMVERQVADLTTILAELDSRLTELARVVQVLDERSVTLGHGTADGYHALTSRLDVHAGAVGQLHAHPVIRESTLWQRLRWLVTGR